MERQLRSSTSMHLQGLGSLVPQQGLCWPVSPVPAWLGSLCLGSGPDPLQHRERGQVIVPGDPASGYSRMWILSGQAVSWILYNNAFKKELIQAEMTVLILCYFNINHNSLLHSRISRKIHLICKIQSQHFEKSWGFYAFWKHCTPMFNSCCLWQSVLNKHKQIVLLC